MPSRLLPPRGSPELEELKEKYRTCPPEKIGEFSKKCKDLYGFSSIDSFVSSMSKVAGVKREPPAKPLPVELSGELEQQVLDIVRKEAVSVGEISRQVDRSAETVIKTIDSLREKNYEVNLDETSRQVFIPQMPSRVFKPTEFKYFKKFYRFGIVSDTQICSKYQQMTLLHDAYKDFNNRQVDFVLHGGDVGDGLNMYRGHHNEVFKHGANEQRDYIADNYPSLERNRRTYMIGGQHDFCWFKQNGYDILEAICEKRKDLVYRGFFDAKFKVKGLDVGLHHPGGGVAYARSYKLQKYIENLVGFIASIPNTSAPILQLFGHWHIPCHLPLYMGIDAISLPCFQSQTPYLAEKGLMPVVGYVVAEIYLDKDNNLSSTKIEFIIMNARIVRADY